MNGQNLKRESKTDGARVDAMTDDEIDTSDIPECDDEFFAKAELRMPKDKHSVLLSIDEETYEWCAEQGPDFRFRMNAALKIYADAHR